MTASAVCLEPGHPSGTVLRLARNLGVPSHLIDRLQLILAGLSAVASGESSEKAKETEIIHEILSLTLVKIRSILKKLRHPDIQRVITRATESLREGDAVPEQVERIEFRHWISNLHVLVTLEPNTAPVELIPHIKWASQARWKYSEDIEALFCPDGEELPSWINHVYKLGRYHVAAKIMLKMATTQPALFTAIRVEAVEAPEQHSFSVPEENEALEAVVRRLTSADHRELMAQLGKTWLTQDPELRFRKACNIKLTTHAEMQLLSFYDHHPELTPRLLFMGTSKKACFLCYRFMSRHPLTMSLSACHQKLYPSWMPAPCSSSAVRKEHKVLLWELSRHLEKAAARDLETRLGILRRPNNPDSTAGPSLPTTESIISGGGPEELSIYSARQGSEAAEEGVLP